MKRRILASLAGLALCLPLWAQKQPFSVDALLRVARISDPQLAPNGKSVAFVVQNPDVANNTRPNQIYVVPLEGGTPRQLTTDGSNSRPRWSPDSRSLYFLSTRSGSSQMWGMDADGLNQRQLSRVSTEVGGITVVPDGKHILFVSNVFPECASDDVCNQRKLEDEAKSKVKARVITGLLYRHWNEYQGKRRQHILVMNTDGSDARDLTPGPGEAPPFSLGGPEQYVVSPDGGEVAFTMNVDPDAALSTNSDIYVTPITGGEIKKITSGPGADDGPLYSPDGKYMAFRSQTRGGYESDRPRLMVLERLTGKTLSLTEMLDRWVGDLTWSPDSTRIFFTTEDRGRTGLQMIQATGGGTRNIVSGSSTLSNVQFTADGRTMIYEEQSGSKPAEIFRATSGGGTGVPLTHLNDALLARATLTPLEEVWVDSVDRTKVHAFVVKPPDFVATRKYPVLLLIHGGPQGAWGETWSYRWNAQVFASAGYVVVMPNPRGSTGYGQKFIDDINGDWGGKAYEDIMAVTDFVSKQPYVDADRMAAAGGSYGGYMVNWMLGHTNRFKAFVSHSGPYDLRGMTAETEELWFPNWEFKGMPWDNPEMYEKWSPSNYSKEFKTPTLVFHGELDYRVPVGQGMQLFTSLQMHKVPSKMVLFPDEGHWILKPQNSQLWYSQFLDWIGEWTQKTQ